MVKELCVVCINNNGFPNLLEVGKQYAVNVIGDNGILLDEIANTYFSPTRFVTLEDYNRLNNQESCTLKIMHRSNIATIVECQSCKCTFNGTFSNIHGVPQSNPKYCIHCGRRVNNIEM